MAPLTLVKDETKIKTSTRAPPMIWLMRYLNWKAEPFVSSTAHGA